MQGRFARFHLRILHPAALLLGLVGGSACLGLALDLVAKPSAALTMSEASTLGLVGLVALACGDVWTLVGRHYIYPISIRRQTSQRLVFSRGPESMVGLLWGLHAGVGVATYRTTSGLWGIMIIVALGLTPAWTVVGYGLGFSIALAAVIWTPTGGPDGAARAARGAARVARLMESRGTGARVVYLSASLAALAHLAPHSL